MTETATAVAEKPEAQTATEEVVKSNLMEPMDFLQKFERAPSKATVESWKAQAPNGTIRIYAPTDKRAYIVRGISGMELQGLQGRIPENLGANLPQEQRAAKLENELQLLVAAHCTLWASTTTDNKLTVDILRAGSAGLPGALFNLISWLSDFVDPETFQLLSADL